MEAGCSSRSVAPRKSTSVAPLLMACAISVWEASCFPAGGAAGVGDSLRPAITAISAIGMAHATRGRRRRAVKEDCTNEAAITHESAARSRRGPQAAGERGQGTQEHGARATTTTTFIPNQRQLG